MRSVLSQNPTSLTFSLYNDNHLYPIHSKFLVLSNRVWTSKMNIGSCFLYYTEAPQEHDIYSSHLHLAHSKWPLKSLWTKSLHCLGHGNVWLLVILECASQLNNNNFSIKGIIFQLDLLKHPYLCDSPRLCKIDPSSRSRNRSRFWSYNSIDTRSHVVQSLPRYKCMKVIPLTTTHIMTCAQSQILFMMRHLFSLPFFPFGLNLVGWPILICMEFNPLRTCDKVSHLLLPLFSDCRYSFFSPFINAIKEKNIIPW